MLYQFKLFSMELSKKESKEKPRDLWKYFDESKYQVKAINVNFVINNIIDNLNDNDFNHLNSFKLQFLL